MMFPIVAVLAGVIVSQAPVPATDGVEDLAGALNAGKVTLCEAYTKLRPLVQAVPRVWRMSYSGHRRDDKWMTENTDKHVEVRTLFLNDQVQDALAAVLTEAVGNGSAADIEKALRDVGCVADCVPFKHVSAVEDLPLCQRNPWLGLLARAKARIAELRAADECAADPACQRQRKDARRVELEESICADARRRDRVLAKIQEERKYATDVGVADLSKLQSFKEQLQDLDKRLARAHATYREENGKAFKVTPQTCAKSWRDLDEIEPPDAGE